MKRLALTACILTLLAAAPAMAQMPQAGQGADSYQAPAATEGGRTGQMTMEQGFQDVDRDRDGLVSESEMRESQGDEAFQERSFRELDQDGDGMLSQEEYGQPRMSGGVGERGAAGGADEYGITRQQGVTGGVSPIDGSGQGQTQGEGERGAPEESAGQGQSGKGGDWGLTGPGAPEEPRGAPGDIRGGGEVGDQEGAGPAEVPNVETYGGRDYDTTPEYGLPPAGAQGGSAAGPSGTYRERGSGGAEKEAGGTSGR